LKNSNSASAPSSWYVWLPIVSQFLWCPIIIC